MRSRAATNGARRPTRAARALGGTQVRAPPGRLARYREVLADASPSGRERGYRGTTRARPRLAEGELAAFPDTVPALRAAKGRGCASGSSRTPTARSGALTPPPSRLWRPWPRTPRIQAGDRRSARAARSCHKRRYHPSGVASSTTWRRRTPRHADGVCETPWMSGAGPERPIWSGGIVALGTWQDLGAACQSGKMPTPRAGAPPANRSSGGRGHMEAEAGARPGHEASICGTGGSGLVARPEHSRSVERARPGPGGGRGRTSQGVVPITPRLARRATCGLEVRPGREPCSPSPPERVASCGRGRCRARAARGRALELRLHVGHIDVSPSSLEDMSSTTPGPRTIERQIVDRMGRLGANARV